MIGADLSCPSADPRSLLCIPIHLALATHLSLLYILLKLMLFIGIVLT
ncbi:hypothetical protein BVRB_3g064500 [Beta vulgaris subsp. vulgaris]|nr:hypothetical protein BVRB_3g064500 [Beta vulgaris subsp. vulgaris]